MGKAMTRLMAMAGWLALFSPSAFAGLEIADLGKAYTCDYRVTPAWLQNHIERDEDVVGGNTSIRNETVDSLDWKANPSANGYGYYLTPSPSLDTLGSGPATPPTPIRRGPSQ